MSGIVLLNKPKGLSSNQALQKVRRLFCQDKAGHTGTLDPMATGMLPICFGSATKVIEYLLDADKAYRATIKLGEATDTGDAEGVIITACAIPILNETLIESVLKHFRGPLSQVPPMYSALKHQGKPLYELARQGLEIERQARAITIYELTVVDFTTDTLTVDVKCSKGTYVRTLAEDIAKQLGTCGHLIALHRRYCAGFKDQPMVTLEQLTEMNLSERQKHVLPADAGLQHSPILAISEQQYRELLQGKTVQFEQPLQSGDYRLYYQDRLVALANIGQQAVKNRKFVDVFI